MFSTAPTSNLQITAFPFRPSLIKRLAWVWYIGLGSDGILQTCFEWSERSDLKRRMHDEQTLLNGLHQLDPQAITLIHEQHFNAVYRYACYRLGDASAAEDVAAETFARLIEAAQARRGPKTSLRGWLMGTASHLVHDHYRQAYARPEESFPEELEAFAPDPSWQAEHSEHQRALRLALQQLTVEQQHVLALRFGSDHSLIETAKIMGKKVNAIKQLQFRALESLRQRLGEQLQ